MKFANLSPSTPALKRALSALLLVVGIALLNVPAWANGTGAKAAPAPRPVARLISTLRTEDPAPRAREIASVNSAPRSSAAVRPVAIVANDDERRAFDMINAQRRQRGQRPLIWDSELTRMARFHSSNMARQGFFNHVDREGHDMLGRANLFGIEGWRALGENIAYNRGYVDAAGYAVDNWMKSDKHRHNILNSDFTHAGLGVAKDADGRIYFTQVFMTR